MCSDCSILLKLAMEYEKSLKEFQKHKQRLKVKQSMSKEEKEKYVY
jgi:hypothetical protein